MIVDKINTRHGTNNKNDFSHGNCLPYTGVPFGMNYFAPQTSEDKRWWFNPYDHTFQGFRLTHQPSPWMGDFSHMLLLPISGSLKKVSIFGAQSSYRPAESILNPHQIIINELRYQLTAQLVPSCYGGILEVEYKEKQAGLLLELPGRYALDTTDSNTLQGWVINYTGCEDPDFKFYFSMNFEQPFTLEERSGGIVFLNFGDIDKQVVRIGTSFISQNQAQINLARELLWSMDDYIQNSAQQWENYLKRIEVNHHDEKQVETFYHNFYRIFLFPQKFYEYDDSEQRIHYDTLSKESKKGILYTNNGFWDTYKTVYPLFSLLAKEQYEEILQGLLNSYRESGFLPKWLSPDERGLMPGTLVDAVIADAAVKDIGLEWIPELFEGMKKGATVQSENPNYGRKGTIDYLKYGYVPCDYEESVNHTLDYAYSDFCISQVAKRIGDSEAENFCASSQNYKQLFDRKSGLMRAKDRLGKFREPFDAYSWGKDYAEGSAWQTSFSVFQDFAGLISEFGGSDNFEKKLIQLCNQAPDFRIGGYDFEIHEISEMAALEFGQVAISNQPSFHYPYLFSYIGKPEMGQPLIKQLLTQLFDSGPEGYPGDEDNGSMAGWYIFSSLGFYPVTPGSGQYVIGMPLFDEAIIHLSSGKDLLIQVSPNYSQQQFVENVILNEKSYNRLYFSHDELTNGGKIEFELGIVPHPRKHDQSDFPYSLSDQYKQ